MTLSKIRYEAANKNRILSIHISSSYPFVKFTLPYKQQKVKMGNKGDCPYCGLYTHLTRDHIIPKSRVGNTGDKNNYQRICWPCNQMKGQLDDKTFRGRIYLIHKNLHSYSRETQKGETEMAHALKEAGLLQ